MDKIVIIGNGFDIFHSIKSRYSDFKQFIEEYDSALFYRLENFFDTPDLWSDFEENLSKLDLQELVEDSFDYIDGDDEHPMRDDAIVTDSIEDSINQLTSGLRNHLNEWVLKFEYPQNPSRKFNFFTEETRFISFNYSETLQRLYSIDDANITYVHNKAEKQRISHHELVDSDLIIGHSVRKSPNIEYKQNPMAGMANWYAEDAFSDAKRYYINSFKDVANNLFKLDEVLAIGKSCTDVYIVGHSLSNVDIEYFKYIAQKLSKNVQYTITHYGTKELQSIQTQAQQFAPISRCSFIDLSNPICILTD